PRGGQPPRRARRRHRRLPQRLPPAEAVPRGGQERLNGPPEGRRPTIRCPRPSAEDPDMINELGTTDSRWQITAPGLLLEYRWTGDRWSHALELGTGPDRVRVAVAIEGD